MFKRRDKPTRFWRMRQFLWPDMGLRRLGTYLLHRVRRLPGTPYSIAAGFACGAAASCTPLIGFHFILSILLAWVMRANWVAAMIGTAVGNPWTFPFIWYCTFFVGTRLLGLDGSGEAPVELSFSQLIDHPGGILVPLLVGAVPVGVLTWGAFFFPLNWLVTSYQQHRAKAREAALRRRVGNRVMPEDPAR